MPSIEQLRIDLAEKEVELCQKEKEIIQKEKEVIQLKIKVVEAESAMDAPTSDTSNAEQLTTDSPIDQSSVVESAARFTTHIDKDTKSNYNALYPRDLPQFNSHIEAIEYARQNKYRIVIKLDSGKYYLKSPKVGRCLSNDELHRQLVESTVKSHRTAYYIHL
tara:strand:+ start:979 stop:1467 length:489 start_codon:yes stop_codon:yes gene_type:complete